jgi:hypothetical protein
MRRRLLLAVLLWIALVAGVLAMPAAVVVGSEDGPMPAEALWHKKSLARTVVLAGGGLAAAAAVSLYGISRRDRRRT